MIKAQIEDPITRQVSCVHGRDGIGGVVVYTREYEEPLTTTRPFLNADFGNNLAQDGTEAASPAPINIHDGLDNTYWTGSNIVGSSVTFNSTARPRTGAQSIDVNGMSLNDVFQIDKGSSQSLSGYSVLKMWVNIDRRWDAGDEISIFGYDTAAGAQVGDSVLLSNYIDIASFDVWQQAIIPLEDMNLTDESITGFRWQQTQVQAQPPEFYLDDIKIADQGITFIAQPDLGTIFYVDSIRFTFMDNATSPASNDPNTLIGTTLTNGFLINREDDGELIIARVLASSADFFSFGFNEIVFRDNGTNTIQCLEVNFKRPVKLNAIEGDDIRITVRDDLSGFLLAEGIIRGERVDINNRGG